MNGDGGSLEGATSAEVSASTRIRLLMVDDDANLLKTLRRWAEHFAEVEVATSGHEAIERLRDGRPFDCVLSDVQMKNGTGVEVATWLREQRPDLYGRLVFMSGMAHPPLEGHESVPRMTKPFPLGKLQALLTRLAESPEA